MREGYHKTGECSGHRETGECCTRREAGERRCSEAENADLRNDAESGRGAPPVRHGKETKFNQFREHRRLHTLAAPGVRDVETTQHIRHRCRGTGESETEMALGCRT